ncbi:MAG: hypothetical protein M1836_006592 [Candelina mexicana]|nr:MAG: hypothetical protein M1836_006592 [Candelina mexicana]
MAEQTLNIPQLLAVILVGFLAIRWYFYSSISNTTPNSRQSQDSRNAGRRADPRQVEQIAQMFPQAGRREIQWDLQRNGGSMAATTERLISGRGLETPPPSFQPQPQYRTTNSSTSTPSKPAFPDLITRYNLSSKLSSSESSTPASSSSANIAATTSKQAWSTNKNERQQLLQRRREEMILAARRKLEEKDRASKGGGQS